MRFLPRFFSFLAAASLAQAGWKELGTLPGGAVAWEYRTVLAGGSVLVSGVSFTTGQYDFRVIDNPPESRLPLAAALAGAGAQAGVNGGYFHKDFTPLGLVVSEGRPIHAFEKAKLLSGLLTVRGKHPELVRAENFKPGAELREALQAGPWLVAGGVAVENLNPERLARRTVVANDGRNHWAILTISPITLEDAARILASEKVAGDWSIRNALNLDGGSSTSLVAQSEDRFLFNIPSFGPVRNYLAIVPVKR